MIEENVLPEGWVRTMLEQIVEIRDDLRQPVNSEERAKRVGPYPYYGATGQVGCIDGYLMDGEYVLLGEDGAPFLDPFKAKAYMVIGKCWVNNHAHILHEISGISNNRFIMHMLNASDYREVVNGTTRLKLTQAAMKQLPVKLPPLKEQHRIVAAIEQQFSRLDAGVAALQRAKAKLKRYRAAVLKAAVEGELTETWRAEHPTIESASLLLERILKERRAKWEADLRAKGKDPSRVKYNESLASDVEGLPDSWCWTTIGQITECLDYKRVPINKEARAKRAGTIPYYGANGQVGWIDDFIFDEPLVLVVEDETFTGREISFSYKITGKAWVNNHAHVLRATSAVHVDYLNYSLAYYPFTPLTQGTTGRRKLTQNALVQAPFALPPFAEQEQIVAEVERHLSLINQLEITVEVNLKRAERLRQSILREAFAGRLVPQDPTDEPADALLERIQSERNGKKNGIDVNIKKNRSIKVPEPVTLDVGEAEQAELWESVGN